MIYLSDLIKDENSFKEVNGLLLKHAEFLIKVGKPLLKLSIARPEIFRRQPDYRIKELKSIVDKLNRDGKELNALFTGHLKDIAGIRLTIATKNQYKQAKNLIFSALNDVGIIDPKELWGSNKRMNERGYIADHYIIRKKDSEIKCEIQVRTLTHDLWAVFTHYEAYKKEEQTDKTKNKKSTKKEDEKLEELINYSRLMDISDWYAISIRKRKIQEANKYHYSKAQEAGLKQKDAIDFKFLEKIIQDKSNKSNEREKWKLETINDFKLCDVLKYLSRFEIYSKKDVKIIFSNNVFIEGIKKELAELFPNMEVEKIPIETIDVFEILCQCYFKYKANFKAQNLESEVSDEIEKLVVNWKNEFDMKEMLSDAYAKMDDQILVKI